MSQRSATTEKTHIWTQCLRAGCSAHASHERTETSFPSMIASLRIATSRSSMMRRRCRSLTLRSVDPRGVITLASCWPADERWTTGDRDGGDGAPATWGREESKHAPRSTSHTHAIQPLCVDCGNLMANMGRQLTHYLGTERIPRHVYLTHYVQVLHQARFHTRNTKTCVSARDDAAASTKPTEAPHHDAHRGPNHINVRNPQQI